MNNGNRKLVKLRAEMRSKLAPLIDEMAKQGMSDVAIMDKLESEHEIMVSKQMVGKVRKEYGIKAGLEYHKANVIQQTIDAWNKHQNVALVCKDTGCCVKTVRQKLRDFHRDGLIVLPIHLQKKRKNQFSTPPHTRETQERASLKAKMNKKIPNDRRNYFIERLKEKTPAAEWHFVEAEMQKRRA